MAGVVAVAPVCGKLGWTPCGPDQRVTSLAVSYAKFPRGEDCIAFSIDGQVVLSSTSTVKLTAVAMTTTFAPADIFPAARPRPAVAGHACGRSRAAAWYWSGTPAQSARAAIR